MDDATKFTRIFGDHRGRSTYAARLMIRDANFIADLKQRISGHAARDNRARNSGWLIEFSPTQTDDLTERSIFNAILTSATEGERHLSFAVGRDWVQMGGAAMESSVRSNVDNIERALELTFRRAVLPRRAVAPARASMAEA